MSGALRRERWSEAETHTKMQACREGDVKTEAETGISSSMPRDMCDAGARGGAQNGFFFEDSRRNKSYQPLDFSLLAIRMVKE